MASNRTGSSKSQGSEGASTPIGGWVIGAVFLLVMAWFLIGPNLLDPHAQAVIDQPLEELQDVGATKVTLGPLREVLTEPRARIGSLSKKCSECHSIFKSHDGDKPRRLSQHTHIEFNHGMNDRCFNCHMNEDRNYFVSQNGERIEFANVEMLCSKCHGPTYRDWQAGTHGRVDGYWDTTRGEANKLTCTNCHNPHSPAFGQMATFPGPHTLRMVEDEHGAHEGPSATDLKNPLRRWRYRNPEIHQSAAGNNPYHDEDGDQDNHDPYDDDHDEEEGH